MASAPSAVSLDIRPGACRLPDRVRTSLTMPPPSAGRQSSSPGLLHVDQCAVNPKACRACKHAASPLGVSTCELWKLPACSHHDRPDPGDPACIRGWRGLYCAFTMLHLMRCSGACCTPCRSSSGGDTDVDSHW